jgi:CRP-like cAMP-binding protein
MWKLLAVLEGSYNNWIFYFNLIDSSEISLYYESLFFIITTITTVGYGYTYPVNTIERVFTGIIMILSIYIYSAAVGKLANIFETTSEKEKIVLEKLQVLKVIAKQFNLSQEFSKKIKQHIKNDTKQNHIKLFNFIDGFHDYIKNSIVNVTINRKIVNFQFLRHKNRDFVVYVARKLHYSSYLEDEYIYKYGQNIKELFFISKGTISYCLGIEYEEKEFVEFKRNLNFGEIEMFQNNSLDYNIKVKSREVNLFYLTKEDFIKLSISYKTEIEEFLNRSMQNYLNFIEVKKKLEDNEKTLKLAKSMSMKSYANSESTPENARFNKAITNTLSKTSSNIYSNDELAGKLENLNSILINNRLETQNICNDVLILIEKIRENLSNENLVFSYIAEIKEVFTINSIDIVKI